MGFGDLKTKAGQQTLNTYLSDKSYIEGFQPSQSDVVVFEALGSAPPVDLAHALRWYKHILSYGDEKSSFHGAKKPLSAFGPPSTVAQPTKADDDDDDDDDDEDLFGSDTEEQKEALQKLKEERVAAYAAKKAAKPKVVAKSNLILDVKPWDDQTGYEVKVMHEWTDGCSTQYKSRHCMGDVAQSSVDFGYLTIRNYFETSHAKGPQDGAGANLKHKADMAVIKRQVVIRNAKELFEYGQSTMQDPAPSRYQSENVQLKRRIFFYDDNIQRNRRDRYFKEVKGNRSIHSIMSTDGGSTLSSRDLSCYCDACLEGEYESCDNSSYVKCWQEQELQHEGGHHRNTVTRSDASTNLERIKYLATKDAVVAIAAGDRGAEYYLLKVTGEGPEILKEEQKDDWEATYPPGAEIIRGFFFISDNDPNTNTRKQFHCNEQKVAFVYAATVRYICPELPFDGFSAQGPVYHVDEELHLDILGALDGF